MSVFAYVLSSAEAVLLSDPRVEISAFSADSYFSSGKHHPKAILMIPVLRSGEIFGVLHVENDFNSDAFTTSHIQLLQLLCSQAALSIDNARLYSRLERNKLDLEEVIKQRTSELEERNSQLQQSKEEAEKATVSHSSVIALCFINASRSLLSFFVARLAENQSRISQQHVTRNSHSNECSTRRRPTAG